MSTSPDGTGLTGDPVGQRRTFVLIPGAGGTAWYWHRVVPLLQEAGHEAIAVDLPGDDPAAGLPEYAHLVASAIGSRGNLVLVAQSLGGFTAPLVAAKVPVGSVVLVNAMIPCPGETPGTWWDNTGWADARVAAAEQGGYGTEFDLALYFLHDVPPEVAAVSRTSGPRPTQCSGRPATSAPGRPSRSGPWPERTTGSSRSASSRH
jgi:pimeloyl-ACP methyl ester carboxylesterase